MGKRSDPAHGWQQRQNALQRKRVRAERAMVVSGADKPIFTYAAMDAETRIVVQQRASEIKTLGRKVADDIFEMGAKFADVRDRLRHNKAGGFEGWIEHEGFKRRFVYNVIGVYEAFANRANFAQLDVQVSALYLLVAPSTTNEVRQTLIQRAEAGATITYTAAKRAIDQHKPAAPPPAPIQPMDDSAWEGLANADPASDAEDIKTAFTPFASLQRVKETGTAVMPPPMMPLNTPPAAPLRVMTPPPGGVMPAAASGKSHTVSVLTSSDSNEWYTPARYVNAARVLMEGIDLDPASCAFANETVGAARIFALEDNGLAQEWRGRVWINPPYGKEDGESNQARWSAKLISEWRAGRIDHAVLLVNASTGSQWFQALWQYPICFTDHRIKFNNAAGVSSQPTQSNAFVYFGDALERFIDVFSAFGVIVPKAIRRSASR